MDATTGSTPRDARILRSVAGTTGIHTAIHRVYQSRVPHRGSTVPSGNFRPTTARSSKRQTGLMPLPGVGDSLKRTAFPTQPGGAAGDLGRYRFEPRLGEGSDIEHEENVVSGAPILDPYSLGITPIEGGYYETCFQAIVRQQTASGAGGPISLRADATCSPADLDGRTLRNVGAVSVGGSDADNVNWNSINGSAVWRFPKVTGPTSYFIQLQFVIVSGASAWGWWMGKTYARAWFKFLDQYTLS